MLRLVLILVSSFILSANSLPKAPVVIYSQKLTLNKLLDIATYEGGIKIIYDDYYIITDKMIMSTYKKNGRKLLDNVEFPNTVRIIKKDLSETIIAPNAIYSAKTSEIKSAGKIYVEKDNQLFTTDFITIYLGVAKGLEQINR